MVTAPAPGRLESAKIHTDAAARKQIIRRALCDFKDARQLLGLPDTAWLARCTGAKPYCADVTGVAFKSRNGAGFAYATTPLNLVHSSQFSSAHEVTEHQLPTRTSPSIGAGVEAMNLLVSFVGVFKIPPTRDGWEAV